MKTIQDIDISPTGKTLTFTMTNGEKIVKTYESEIHPRTISNVDRMGYAVMAMAGIILDLTERLEKLERADVTFTTCT